jgi:hypothetical protein
MSTEARDVGMDWAIEKLRELAQKAGIPLDDVYWDAEVENENTQVLVVAASGTEKKWEVADLDLEDETRRPQLERVIQAVVDSLL